MAILYKLKELLLLAIQESDFLEGKNLFFLYTSLSLFCMVHIEDKQTGDVYIYTHEEREMDIYMAIYMYV